MANIDYRNIKQGVYINMEGKIYLVLDSVYSKKSRQLGSNQTKLKEVSTGKVTDKTFHASDQVREADIHKTSYIFIYSKGEEVWLHEVDDKSKRFSIPTSLVKGIEFMKQNSKVTAVLNDENILSIYPDIKVDLVVKESPPSIKGNTAQGGSKKILLETGTYVSAPLFINTGDVVTVNTETGEYVSRSEKN